MSNSFIWNNQIKSYKEMAFINIIILLYMDNGALLFNLKDDMNKGTTIYNKIIGKIWPDHSHLL